METRFANAIRSFAMGETNPSPTGKVTDYINEPGEDATVRYGWKHLKEIFEVAARYTEKTWRIAGYLDGVRLKGKRVPTPNGGVQWCGIFATYCWIKAGVPGVYWGSPGVKGPNVKLIYGTKGIGVGDIAVLTGALVHHCLISSVNGPDDKRSTGVETINGNSDWQSIKVKSNKLSDFAGYYTLRA